MNRIDQTITSIHRKSRKGEVFSAHHEGGCVRFTEEAAISFATFVLEHVGGDSIQDVVDKASLVSTAFADLLRLREPQHPADHPDQRRIDERDVTVTCEDGRTYNASDLTRLECVECRKYFFRSPGGPRSEESEPVCCGCLAGQSNAAIDGGNEEE